MRVLAIRGRNLASIAGDFDVDFEAEPLAGSGIFAITGPTGAGKSTLLDALNLALFNELPRLRAAPDRSQVGDGDTLSAKDPRAILRHGTGDGFAEVDFAMPGGPRYRARWSVKRARGRADGRIQNHEHQFERLDTGERLGGTRTETLAAIREVIGLSAEQFGRAVLLAQGDFEAFIRADANDRALLLERLTGSAVYARLGQRAWEKASALRSNLDALRRDIAAQNGLGDEERAEAEARRDAALAEEQTAKARLGELAHARQWEQRCAELADSVAREEEAEAEALAAVHDAEPRSAALVRNRTAFGFSGEWQALTQAARLRDEAAGILMREQASLAEAQKREADAATRENDALCARAKAEAEGAALAPKIAEARALDLQLAEAARRLETQQDEDDRRSATLAEAIGDEAAARKTHDEVDAAHARHLAWLTAHAAWQQLAQREEELAESLGAYSKAETALTGKAAERADCAAEQQTALSRWSAAQEALAQSESGYAGAVSALASADAALPPETRLAELTTARDALADIARVLDEFGHAQVSASSADEALATTRRRQADIAKRETGAAALLASLADELPLLRARQGEARRACALADAAAEEAAQVLRAGLENGEPCPVCGATEHRLTALDALLGEQRLANRERAEELDAELAAKNRQLAEATAEQRALAKQAEDLDRDLAEQTRALAVAVERRDGVAADLAARAASAGLPGQPEALAPALTARRAVADADLTALGEARAAANLARQEEQTARKRLDKARADQGAAQDALQVLTRTITEIDRDLADLERERERLALLLGRALAPLGDWQALVDPLTALRVSAGEWRDQAQGRDAAAQALPSLRAALSAASDALATARAFAKGAGETLARARENYGELLTARKALLGGEDTEAVASRLTATSASATETLEQARSTREHAGQARVAAEARVAGAISRLDKSNADHAGRGATLAAKLAAADLSSEDIERVAAAGSDALDAEAKALAALESALGERRAVLAKCRKDLASHEASGRPVLLGPELTEALAAASASCDQAAARRGDVEFTLRRDDDVRDRTARLRARLEQESAAAEVWLKLAELIGDADGKKFRRFAQGLTLDRLLEHANARLADLKPRYTLERGFGGDMLIQVIDSDMAGEVRGLHNLSGGERFLVSLALALGLAEMSTTNGVRIESLFIDEGFGALDPSSLGQAVALLEHLHASGRRVGVISHVEELKERIPVKIEVKPTGRGTSEIAVVAG